jgi:isocitrate/isopropylmalate dehydrogenase
VVRANLFGDIMFILAAGLVGGLGPAAGLSAGPRHAMAQATQGSAPDIAGLEVVNPTAMIISTAILLKWLGQQLLRLRQSHAPHLARRRRQPRANALLVRQQQQFAVA